MGRDIQRNNMFNKKDEVRKKMKDKIDDLNHDLKLRNGALEQNDIKLD